MGAGGCGGCVAAGGGCPGPGGLDPGWEASVGATVRVGVQVGRNTRMRVAVAVRVRVGVRVAVAVGVTVIVNVGIGVLVRVAVAGVPFDADRVDWLFLAFAVDVASAATLLAVSWGTGGGVSEGAGAAARWFSRSRLASGLLAIKSSTSAREAVDCSTLAPPLVTMSFPRSPSKIDWESISTWQLARRH